ncbi:MAG: BlaI/MecI/CopY family transcriptional regulator [Acutalibacteraceae bacterium]
MDTPKIFESEYRFCLILWENEPISCANAAALCKEKLGWSRTTTYTVIKRLEDRGFLKKDGSTVTTLFSKEQIQIAEMDEFIDKTFEGSLPSFIAAFAKKQKLSQKDLDEIQKILDK